MNRCLPSLLSTTSHNIITPQMTNQKKRLKNSKTHLNTEFSIQIAMMAARVRLLPVMGELTAVQITLFACPSVYGQDNGGTYYVVLLRCTQCAVLSVIVVQMFDGFKTFCWVKIFVRIKDIGLSSQPQLNYNGDDDGVFVKLIFH